MEWFAGAKPVSLQRSLTLCFKSTIHILSLNLNSFRLKFFPCPCLFTVTIRCISQKQTLTNTGGRYMFCAIWYHWHNLENVKNTHGVVILLVKLQASACNFTKNNTPAWVLFTFFKLYKWYQIS